MRFVLKTLIICLVIIFFIITLIICRTTLSIDSKISNIAQLLSAFAAMISAVIALLLSQPKINNTKIQIHHDFDWKDCENYELSDLGTELKNNFKDYESPLISYKIILKMKNVSSIDLITPIISIRIPKVCQHPDATKLNLECRSNLYNNQKEIIFYDFDKHQLITNKLLPYWNQGDILEIWIRLLLSEQIAKNNKIVIYINCKNASGFTKEIELINIYDQIIANRKSFVYPR